MTSANPLLVLASSEPGPRSQRDLRQSVEAVGGKWMVRPSTFREVVSHARAQAPGSFVLLIGAQDNPTAATLASLDRSCASNVLADVLYGDKEIIENRRTGDAQRLHFPDWSPLRMRYEQFVGDTFLVRVSALISIGSTFDGHEQWDNWAFLKRCVDLDVRVHHVDDVWVQRSSQKSVSNESSSHSQARSTEAASFSKSPALAASYSLITLTAGANKSGPGSNPIVEDHLAAIRASDARKAEHIVVVGEECDSRVRATLSSDKTLKILSDSTPFNFARRANLASRVASGEILVFINDDFVPNRPDWLEKLIEPFADEHVGITGGTLLFADDTVQHVGVGTIDGSDCHFYRGAALSEARVASLIEMNREVDAVTGACLAIRSNLFDEVGGFFEGFPLNYNDIDLCLKVRLLGHSVIHVGAPLGHHFESITREAVILPEEAALFYSRWPMRPLQSRYPFECFG